MSLECKAFKKFRDQALLARKQKYTEKHCLEVTTTKEIAEALSKTSLIAGKFIQFSW
jgi:hypothetical protein